MVDFTWIKITYTTILALWLTFLDTGLPLASWLGIIVALMVGLLGFLLRDAYNTLKARILVLEKEVQQTKDLIVKERARLDEEMRKTDKAIWDVHKDILEKIEELSNKINHFISTFKH